MPSILVKINAKLFILRWLYLRMNISKKVLIKPGESTFVKINKKDVTLNFELLLLKMLLKATFK